MCHAFLVFSSLHLFLSQHVVFALIKFQSVKKEKSLLWMAILQIGAALLTSVVS